MSTASGVLGGAYNPDAQYVTYQDKTLAAALAFTSNATLTTLSGFSFDVLQNASYNFVFEGPVTMTTNGGLSVAFNYTGGATMTSVAIEAIQCTASAIAVSAVSTTVTNQNKFIDQKATAFTYIRVSGSLVAATPGTVNLQMAQNTSHSDTTTIALGFQGHFVRTS